MEECVLIDGDILNEVIIPTTNVDRRLSDGSRHKEENVNKSQMVTLTKIKIENKIALFFLPKKML